MQQKLDLSENYFKEQQWDSRISEIQQLMDDFKKNMSNIANNSANLKEKI